MSRLCRAYTGRERSRPGSRRSWRSLERTWPIEEDCRVRLHVRREAAMSYVGVARAGDSACGARWTNGRAGEVRTVVSRRANRA